MTSIEIQFSFDIQSPTPACAAVGQEYPLRGDFQLQPEGRAVPLAGNEIFFGNQEQEVSL